MPLSMYIYTIYIYILLTSFICVSMWFMVYWSFWSATKARHGSTENPPWWFVFTPVFVASNPKL